MAKAEFKDFLAHFDKLALQTGKAKSDRDLGKLTSQAQVMFEHLADLQPEIEPLKSAFIKLARNCRYFPTVQEIRDAYEAEARSLRRIQGKGKSEATKAKGCPKCSSGWVHYLTGHTHPKSGRPEKASAPCYYCNKGETGPWPYMIQDRDRIAVAATRIGEHQFRALLAGGDKPQVTSYRPVHTSEALEATFREGPIMCPTSGGLRQQFDQMTKSMEVA